MTENKMKIKRHRAREKKKRERYDREGKNKQITTAVIRAKRLERTDYQADRCRYIFVWSTTMPTTTSDQSESMGKINKAYVCRRADVVDTL